MVRYGCWAMLKYKILSGGGTFPLNWEGTLLRSWACAVWSHLPGLSVLGWCPSNLDGLTELMPTRGCRLLTELICEWIACAGGVLGVGPLHTHVSYIDLHNFSNSEKRKDYDCKPTAPSLCQKSQHGKHRQTEKHLGSSWAAPWVIWMSGKDIDCGVGVIA
jgi:hypothetical protein